jgi:hypothetical protein
MRALKNVSIGKLPLSWHKKIALSILVATNKAGIVALWRKSMPISFCDRLFRLITSIMLGLDFHHTVFENTFCEKILNVFIGIITWLWTHFSCNAGLAKRQADHEKKDEQNTSRNGLEMTMMRKTTAAVADTRSLPHLPREMATALRVLKHFTTLNQVEFKPTDKFGQFTTLDQFTCLIIIVLVYGSIE